jgi:hypothetical protein
MVQKENSPTSRIGDEAEHCPSVPEVGMEL